MKKNTSFSLGDYFDQFVQRLLREGRYKNANEVIQAGLRLLEVEEQRTIALRTGAQLEGVALVSDNLATYDSLSKIESEGSESTVSKLTEKEMNVRIDQSESDFKKGKFKSSTELSAKYK
jgi:putative addiction module CopG family antidote